MSFLKTLSSLEKFILGEKKPKDHWKQYRKQKQVLNQRKTTRIIILTIHLNIDQQLGLFGF